MNVAVLGNKPSLRLDLVAQALVGRLHVLARVPGYLRGEQPDTRLFNQSKARENADQTRPKYPYSLTQRRFSQKQETTLIRRGQNTTRYGLTPQRRFNQKNETTQYIKSDEAKSNKHKITGAA